MSIFDFFSKYKTISFKQKLFRREVEAAYYSKKPLTLPKIKEIAIKDLPGIKQNFVALINHGNYLHEEITEQILSLSLKDKLINKGESILSDNYNIFNSEIIQYTNGIDWHFDRKSGYRFKNILSWRIKFSQTPQGVDITRIWFIARFYFAVDLALAYSVTKDLRYVEKFISVFYDFIEHNNFYSGVNWLSIAEIAIRVINIIFAIPLIIDSEKLDATFFNKLRSFVLHSAYYLENNMEDPNEKDSNRFTACLALLLSGAILKDSEYGKRLMAISISGSEKRIREAVLSDGVLYEQSIGGHLLATRALALIAIYAKSLNRAVTKEFYTILHNMFNVLKAYQRSDLSLPNLGDSPPGRVLNLPDKTENSAGALFAVGAFLFSDGELKKLASGGELAILLTSGKDAFKEYTLLEPVQFSPETIAFQKGGHFIIRDKNLHIFIKAAEIGLQGHVLNSHIDTFSYELFFKNKLFICDPGMHAFYGDEETSMKLRSVNFHNTFFIDNLQLITLKDGKIIKTDLTKPKILKWETNNDSTVFSARHFAYINLPDPVICSRTIVYNKFEQKIIVTDEFIGNQVHRVVCNIPFHPNVEIDQISNDEFNLLNEGVEIGLKFILPEEKFFATIQDSFYSLHYGSLEKSKKINMSFTAQFPLLYTTEISIK